MNEYLRARPHRTLVTGATGFVGAAVARELQAAGYRLRLLHRSRSDCANLRDIEGERVVGDLLDASSLKRAVRGCDAVFHVAADYRLWVPKPEHMYAVNVDGTAALACAAAEAGVQRMLYTSSVATIAAFRDGQVADETTPSRLEQMIGHYKRSKFLADSRLQQLQVELPLEVVTVKPSTPVGPGDIKPTPTGRVLLDAANRRIPAYVDTGLNVVDVADVARGHRLAFERGAAGRDYILGGTDMSLRAILTSACVHAGVAPPRVRLPLYGLWPIAFAAEHWHRLRRSTSEPLLTWDGLRMARYKMFYSSARAMTELGYAPVAPQPAIGAAVDWFVQHGYA